MGIPTKRRFPKPQSYPQVSSIDGLSMIFSTIQLLGRLMEPPQKNGGWKKGQEDSNVGLAQNFGPLLWDGELTSGAFCVALELQFCWWISKILLAQNPMLVKPPTVLHSIHVFFCWWRCYQFSIFKKTCWPGIWFLRLLVVRGAQLNRLHWRWVNGWFCMTWIYCSSYS